MKTPKHNKQAITQLLFLAEHLGQFLFVPSLDQGGSRYQWYPRIEHKAKRYKQWLAAYENRLSRG